MEENRKEKIINKFLLIAYLALYAWLTYRFFSGDPSHDDIQEVFSEPRIY